MDTVLGFLADGLGGGLFGILGGLGTAWLKARADEKEREYKLAENDSRRKHDLAMITAETDASIKEIQANVERDQILMDGQADIEESKGRNEAILKLSENYVKPLLVERMMFNDSKWSAWITIPIALMITLIHSVVDISRTLVRVIVTYGAVAFSCYITYMAFDLYSSMGEQMDPEQLYGVILTMLKLLTFTTTTAMSFWFIDKSVARNFQRGK